MIINQEAFQKMVLAITMFRQEPVEVLFKEQKEIEPYLLVLPELWQKFFSSNASVLDTIQNAWNELEAIIPQITTKISNRISFLGLVTSRNRNSIMGIAYIISHSYKDKLFYEAWIGGLPATALDLGQFNSDNKFPLPKSYQIFCGIHNGFLKNGNLASGFLPIHEIPFDGKTITFYEDGAGNTQAYDIMRPAGLNDYMTFDWDHETRELSKPQTFWDFLNKILIVEFG
jgi:hypothetical protein